jgi:hypothetical protein
VRPERIELPTSWFVAMHSIQLSYGRVVEELRLRIINGNQGFRPIRAECASRARVRSLFLFQGNKLRRFVNPSKSFRSSAKPTCLCVLNMHVGNALAMATDMLLLKADEVARNGAFGKILRPEVFPDAPLHFPRPSTSLSRPKPVPLSFPALPRESSPGMRISRETGGLGLSPTERPTPNNTQARTN